MEKIMIVLLSLPLMAMAATEEIDGIEWAFTVEEGKAIIGETTVSGAVSIPSKLGDCAVTAIGKRAFSFCGSLTSVTIPNGVTTIGEFAFSDCVSLTSVMVPNGVTTIGEGAFLGCNALTSVTISKGVMAIGKNAFNGCGSLVLVEIPDSVIKIDEGAFGGCDAVDIRVSPKNPAYQVVDGCLVSKDGKTLVRGAAKSYGMIPSGVTTIGGGAFCGCKSLASVTIPQSVTTIGRRVFSFCMSLESVTIPNGVTTIGEGAFCCCMSLESVTIPNGVRIIEFKVFEGCASLASVMIPDSVTAIGEDAFSKCKSLKTIYVGNAKQMKVRELLKGSGFEVDGVSFEEPVTTEAARRQKTLEKVFSKNWSKGCYSCDLDLKQLFGISFGQKGERGAVRGSFVGMPEYAFVPQKRFLDFNDYYLQYDFNDKVFCISAEKLFDNFEGALEVFKKAREVIERKFGGRMEGRWVKNDAGEETGYLFELSFRNQKTLFLSLANKKDNCAMVMLRGVDAVVLTSIQEIKTDSDAEDAL